MANQNMIKKNNNGYKAFSIVLILATLIGATAAIVRPLSQRSNNLQQQIYDLKAELREHSLKNNHPWGVMGEIGKLKEKFVEVETQFDGERRTMLLLSEKHDHRLDKLEDWRQYWNRTVSPKTTEHGVRLDKLEEK